VYLFEDIWTQNPSPPLLQFPIATIPFTIIPYSLHHAHYCSLPPPSHLLYLPTPFPHLPHFPIPLYHTSAQSDTLPFHFPRLRQSIWSSPAYTTSQPNHLGHIGRTLAKRKEKQLSAGTPRNFRNHMESCEK
jgi:hypothetical protein